MLQASPQRSTHCPHRRTSRWVRGTLLVALAIGALAPTARGQGRRRAERQEVTKLTVTGVQALNKTDLLASLAIAQSSCVSLLLKPFCLFSHSSAFYRREYLNHDDLARDVLRARVFYYERGYRYTTVDTIVTPTGHNQVAVTLRIHEGPPTAVRAIAIGEQGILARQSILKRKEIGEAVRIRRGQPLDLLRVDSTRALLEAKLWDHGYADAVVDTSILVDTIAHQADVRFSIRPGPLAHVAGVEVDGLEHIEQSTILQSLSFAPGDIFRRSAVLTSQRTLYESNLFRRAEIDVTNPNDSLKQVRITVREAPPREMRYSVGFNTVDFMQAEARYTNYNWFGKARRFTAQLTVGNLLARQLNGNGIFYDVTTLADEASESKYFLPTFTASIESRRPWWLSPNNEIALGLFGHRRSSPGIYVDRGYGVSATFTRRMAPRTPLSVNYRYELTGVDASDVYFCVNFGVCDSPTLASFHKYQQLSPLALSVSRDRTDNPFEPRKGTRGQIDAEIAESWTASNFRYGRLAADAAGFLPVGRRSTVGVHVKLGYIKAFSGTAHALGVADSVGDELLHPRKRFYSGGSQSVRGFGEAQLGPRVLTIPAAKLRSDSIGCPATVALVDCQPDAGVLEDRDFTPRPLGGNILAEMSVEYRFPIPIIDDLLGAVFVDAGYLAQKTATNLPKSQTAITPGFGVRYASPVGPIRIDVGINPTRTEKLAVITEDPTTHQLISLNNSRTYAQAKPGFSGFISRLNLHLSIGEAF